MILVKKKKKVEGVSFHAMKAIRGCGVIDSLSPDISTRER
jgi:hypothetical protein